ncbi:MAG: hypothetical protein DRH15_08910, partial [Deltaproteobacteria bacterium]
MRIALVSTPWPLFNRPSIQLGSLKAFISDRLPEVKVDTFHLYLQVAAALGYPLYEEISQSAWLAEPLYAALLYPEQLEAIERFWNRRVSRTNHCKQLPFLELCEKLSKCSKEILSAQDWARYRLIGLSVCFSQLTSSIYFITQIRKMAPDVPIVVGGSSCAGALGKSLLQTFPDITFVIEGEGELPLMKLVQEIATTKAPDAPAPGT